MPLLFPQRLGLPGLLLLSLFGSRCGAAEDFAGSEAEASATQPLSGLPSVTSGVTIGTVMSSLLTVSEGVPTGSYQSYTTRITLPTTSLRPSSSRTSNSAHDESSSSSSSTAPVITFITGGGSANNSTAKPTSTVASAAPQNTQPCNNYREFCTRKYSEITEISTHNSPFVMKGNAASNQELDVTTQLNDGVRMVQGQIQFARNDSVPHFCHSDCNILDAGRITVWLSKIKDWVAAHPFDVVTILLGNGNYSHPDLYVPHIESTGLLQYVYTPPHLPMLVDDWPTLAELILRGKRVIMFMDYDTDPKKYPWLMDEFSSIWETPFNPLDNTFPCVVDRPPSLARPDVDKRMYLVNHNLDVQINAFGATILVPATTVLNQTNGVEGPGSLGLTSEQCTKMWGRPPKFMHVDYYNHGSYPGSVFEVAARINNVTYNRECCGKATSEASHLTQSHSLLAAAVALMVASIII